MKKDTFYFSHDYGARNDPKLVKVLMKLKQEGIGVFWCLVEMMYEQGGYLFLSECDSYAFALHTDCVVLKSVINDFGLFVIKDDKFWSNSVLRRLEHRKEKSGKARISALKRWSDANALQPQYEGNAIKERKGKEKKEKENNINAEERRVGAWKFVVEAYSQDELWCESILRKNEKYSADQISKKLKEFINHLQAQDDLKVGKEFKKHFVNWFALNAKLSDHKANVPMFEPVKK